MLHDKNKWITIFRTKGEELLKDSSKTTQDRNIGASYINKGIKAFWKNNIEYIDKLANSNQWSKEEQLTEILLLTYASYIAMLEYRNLIWPYEFMSFSRRIGELWEPLCILPFKYSIKPLTLINPPKFKKMQTQFINRTTSYINKLSISSAEKENLNMYYSIPWSLIDSGGINLALDLHFEQNNLHYNCDFKSGFSSNEKGNTNRLLLVGSIYKLIDSNENNFLFVRQHEEENNHYLQTLKNSSYWNVYCADECYNAIFHFTGFNLRKWLDENANWCNDISPNFKKYLINNNLLKYLTW